MFEKNEYESVKATRSLKKQNNISTDKEDENILISALQLCSEDFQLSADNSDVIDNKAMALKFIEEKTPLSKFVYVRIQQLIPYYREAADNFFRTYQDIFSHRKSEELTRNDFARLNDVYSLWDGISLLLFSAVQEYASDRDYEPVLGDEYTFSYDYSSPEHFEIDSFMSHMERYFSKLMPLTDYFEDAYRTDNITNSLNAVNSMFSLGNAFSDMMVLFDVFSKKIKI